MPDWTSKQVTPFAVFVSVLIVLAGIVLVSVILIQRQPPAERRGLLPFPESQGEDYLLDDIAGHMHRPNLERRVEWPEHPDRSFVLRTNNLGLREDTATEVVKPPGMVRILVTGDSHIDGVVANSESFPNRLEALLNRASNGPTFEVLNAGTGHYGPPNYRGVLRQYLQLDLDHYVVAIFTGNDLLDAVAAAWSSGSIEIPDRPEGYMQRLQAAQRRSSAAVSQGFNQILFFASFPEFERTAIDLTLSAIDDIDRLCTERKIGLTVVLLPSKYDVEPDTDSATHRAVIDALGIDQRHLGLNRRLARALADELAARELPTLDLLPDFAAADRELYWKRDHHLNVDGHALLAELYFERLGAALLGSG